MIYAKLIDQNSEAEIESFDNIESANQFIDDWHKELISKEYNGNESEWLNDELAVAWVFCDESGEPV